MCQGDVNRIPWAGSLVNIKLTEHGEVKNGTSVCVFNGLKKTDALFKFAIGCSA